jgi:hypothetical protein
MKVTLPDGKVADVVVIFGDEQPKLQRPLPEHLKDKPFRSAKVTVTVIKGDAVVGAMTGTSFCNPGDQFKKSKGRGCALRRMLETDTNYDLLSREDRRAVCRLVFPNQPESKKEKKKKAADASPQQV